MSSYGGTRLVGRAYFLGARPVHVVTGWGPGATVRNVRIRFDDDGTEVVRPFRGLTLQPRAPRGDRQDGACRTIRRRI